MDNNFIIKTESLSFRVGKKVIIDNLNISVNKGEIYGFLGPNGSGKTTTIKCILGLINPAKGKTFLFEKEYSKDRIEILKNIGVLIETPSLYENLTGFENLKIAQILYQLKKEDIIEILHEVELDDFKDLKIKYYSLGMKQRLGIAIALIHNPSLLILDEPFNGLDPLGIIKLRNIFSSLKQRGKTIFLSSHIISEIEKISDKIGILHQGKLLFQGKMEDSKLKYHFKIIGKRPNKDMLNNLEISQVVINDMEMEFDLCNGNRLDECITFLYQNNCKIVSIEKISKSLEDFFINLIHDQTL